MQEIISQNWYVNDQSEAIGQLSELAHSLHLHCTPRTLGLAITDYRNDLSNVTEYSLYHPTAAGRGESLDVRERFRPCVCVCVCMSILVWCRHLFHLFLDS